MSKILVMVYFSINSISYQYMSMLDLPVYTKIWEEEERGNSKLPGLCHQGIDWMRIGIN